MCVITQYLEGSLDVTPAKAGAAGNLFTATLPLALAAAARKPAAARAGATAAAAGSGSGPQRDFVNLAMMSLGRNSATWVDLGQTRAAMAHVAAEVTVGGPAAGGPERGGIGGREKEGGQAKEDRRLPAVGLSVELARKPHVLVVDDNSVCQKVGGGGSTRFALVSFGLQSEPLTFCGIVFWRVGRSFSRSLALEQGNGLSL